MRETQTALAFGRPQAMGGRGKGREIGSGIDLGDPSSGAHWLSDQACFPSPELWFPRLYSGATMTYLGGYGWIRFA